MVKKAKLFLNAKKALRWKKLLGIKQFVSVGAAWEVTGTSAVVGTVAYALTETRSWKMSQLDFRGGHEAQNNHDKET